MSGRVPTPDTLYRAYRGWPRAGADPCSGEDSCATRPCLCREAAALGIADAAAGAAPRRSDELERWAQYCAVYAAAQADGAPDDAEGAEHDAARTFVWYLGCRDRAAGATRSLVDLARLLRGLGVAV